MSCIYNTYNYDLDLTLTKVFKNYSKKFLISSKKWFKSIIVYPLILPLGSMESLEQEVESLRLVLEMRRVEVSSKSLHCFMNLKLACFVR